MQETEGQVDYDNEASDFIKSKKPNDFKLPSISGRIFPLDLDKEDQTESSSGNSNKDKPSSRESGNQFDGVSQSPVESLQTERALLESPKAKTNHHTHNPNADHHV